MSKVGVEGRSFKKISHHDLKRLAQIAYKDQRDFFRQYPKWGNLFAKRVLCIALCQGAAKHYTDTPTGINDFDVYTFYKKHHRVRWYAKRIKSYDFGNAKFGQSIDKSNFIGRRVDCLGREIEFKEGDDVLIAIRRYLQEGKTKTARLLAQKAVILLEPDCSKVVWVGNDAVEGNIKNLSILP